MAVDKLALSVPKKKVSAWVAETEPKAARDWLVSLPMADSSEASREIYQALYTLNRLEIGPVERFNLVELYREPVIKLTKALQSHFQSSIFPLTQKKRKLAEFIREIHAEMATGYKCVVQDLHDSRSKWGKKKIDALATDHAMFYLGKVLTDSYQIYMPCPPGAWQDIHALYRHAEGKPWFGDSNDQENKSRSQVSEVNRVYLRIILLGLSNPYQLPEHEWQHIKEFLERWADKANIHMDPAVTNPAGQFLIDLAADTPPSLFPQDISVRVEGNYRILNVLGLLRIVQDFIVRLNKGKSAQRLDLGMECLESTCVDVLKRMNRFWGLGARRRRPRKKKTGVCLVAYGINAVHFFSSNRKSFVAPVDPSAKTDTPFDSMLGRIDEEDNPPDVDSTFIDLDKSEHGDTQKKSVMTENKLSPAPEVYRVERWQIEDESIGGMLLTSRSTDSQRLRVGDILGLQDVNRDDTWRIGVVRWIKTPSSKRIQVGIEMLAPGITPAAVCFDGVPVSVNNPYVQALLLSPVGALHLPSTLILPAGMYKSKKAFMLAEGDGTPRRIILMDLLTETTLFSQAVYADAATPGK